MIIRDLIYLFLFALCPLMPTICHYSLMQLHKTFGSTTVAKAPRHPFVIMNFSAVQRSYGSYMYPAVWRHACNSVATWLFLSGERTRFSLLPSSLTLELTCTWWWRHHFTSIIITLSGGGYYPLTIFGALSLSRCPHENRTGLDHTTNATLFVLLCMRRKCKQK